MKCGISLLVTVIGWVLIMVGSHPYLMYNNKRSARQLRLVGLFVALIGAAFVAITE